MFILDVSAKHSQPTMFHLFILQYPLMATKAGLTFLWSCLSKSKYYVKVRKGAMSWYLAKQNNCIETYFVSVDFTKSSPYAD